MSKAKGVLGTVALFAFFLALLSFLILIASTTQPLELKQKVSPGNLYSFSDDTLYLSAITDICVKDGFVYVLQGDISLLNVYKDNGEYVRSFAFHNYTNGVSELRIKESQVHLKDKFHNYYIFTDGMFTEYVKSMARDASAQYEETFLPRNEQNKENGYVYYVKDASIYKQKENNEPIQIVQRPFFLSYLKGSNVILTMGICILVFALCNVIMKHYGWKK